MKTLTISILESHDNIYTKSKTLRGKRLSSTEEYQQEAVTTGTFPNITAYSPYWVFFTSRKA